MTMQEMRCLTLKKEPVIEEKDLVEVNGVDVEAAKELKQSIRKDNGVECFLTTKKGGTAWELVTRRVTINSDTGEVIQDLNIDHSIKRNKILHKQLPGGTTNTTAVLYYKDPAVANQVGGKGEIENQAETVENMQYSQEELA